jgi:hypothetical protein
MTLRIVLDTIAEEVFRDHADKDYIAARSNYRMNLREQFLWSGLQACEKYLKAILLFNNLSARFPTSRGQPAKWNNKREFRHNLRRLFAAVSQIRETQFVWPKFLPGFLDYLTRFGDNRYMSISTYTLGDELWRLDETVWTLRSYCQSFDWEIEEDGRKKNMRARLIAEVNDPSRRSKPALFHPFGARGGWLEQVLTGKPSSFARQNLVWHNLFFGGRQRSLANWDYFSSSEHPPQNREWFTPQLHRLVSDYVNLPPPKE